MSLLTGLAASALHQTLDSSDEVVPVRQDGYHIHSGLRVCFHVSAPG